MVAPQCTRPNGLPYRRRAPVRVETYTTADESSAVIVIGTHDVEEAARLARHTWDCDNNPEPLPEGVRRWWRLVPWDTGHGGDRSWIDDPARGRPVVTFEPEP
jgi:hypothetical protein